MVMVRVRVSVELHGAKAMLKFEKAGSKNSCDPS